MSWLKASSSLHAKKSQENLFGESLGGRESGWGLAALGVLCLYHAITTYASYALTTKWTMTAPALPD